MTDSPVCRSGSDPRVSWSCSSVSRPPWSSISVSLFPTTLYDIEQHLTSPDTSTPLLSRLFRGDTTSCTPSGSDSSEFLSTLNCTDTPLTIRLGLSTSTSSLSRPRVETVINCRSKRFLPCSTAKTPKRISLDRPRLLCWTSLRRPI